MAWVLHLSPATVVSLTVSQENNFNRMRLGPGKHLHGQTLMGGVVKGEEFDYFHELVLNQELVRIAARGVADGLQAGMVIGLPPVMNFGPEPLRSKVLEEVFSGQRSFTGRHQLNLS